MVRVVKVTTDNVIQIVELPSWSHKSQKDAIISFLFLILLLFIMA